MYGCHAFARRSHQRVSDGFIKETWINVLGGSSKRSTATRMQSAGLRPTAQSFDAPSPPVFPDCIRL